MKFLGLLIVLFFLTYYASYLYSQVENIPSTHEVYSFLSRMYVKGALEEYDDVILPLSRKQVSSALFRISKNRQNLSNIEQKKLDRLISQLGFLDSNRVVHFFDSFPTDFIQNLTYQNEKHLYSYRDSSIKFYLDPLLEYKFMYSDETEAGSSIVNFGGRIRGTYDDWLGYFIEATNGSVFGNRETASLDKRVEQSYTFNATKINFFDNTQGYLRLEKGPLSLQLGRERILWGTGRINKLILSDNPQMFDFIKFSVSYKSLRYDFLHGWLVMKPEFYQISNDISKEKRSKYIAISRLGISPINDLNLGISQMIIYSNRPMEAAYLNPFIFWESAQRSLNDLDNSFLTFDGKFRLINGLEINATALFDDINFAPLFNGEWALHNNRFAWQAGISLSSPIIFDNITLNFEYIQLRPYIFSHDGYAESLTYTNNGYLLGIYLNPNSTLLSANVEYDISATVSLAVYYDHMMHGNNEYDESGNLLTNYGGNVFEYYRLNDPNYAYLLDGIRETENSLRLNFNWQIINGFYLILDYEYRKNSYYSSNSYNAFSSSLNLLLD
jgi:hypothetical protein